MLRSHNRILLLVLLLLVVPVQAQDSSTTRDPMSLARRLLHFDADYVLPDPSPLYRAGDMADFWVSKDGQDTPTKITASMVVSTRSIYIWVEQGLFFNPQNMSQVASQLERALTLMRLRNNYGELTVIPGAGQVPDPTSLLDIPDVDNDPHVFILYASKLGDQPILVNPNDELPAQIAPGGFSNQHELITVNTSAIPTIPLSDGTFTVLLSERLYVFVADASNSSQAPWLKDASGVLFTKLLNFPDLRPNALTAFLQEPDTALNQPAAALNAAATHGAQQLFLEYLTQRYGFSMVRSLMRQPGSGLEAVDRVLAENQIADLVTGQPVTAKDVFADFVVANVTSSIFPAAFGDGRFSYTSQTLPSNVAPGGTPVRDQLNSSFDDQTVNQFGTRYYFITNSQAADFTVHFEGQASTPLLPLPADSAPENRFYWSGRGENQDSTLTRSFDLRDVDKASLSYDVWYSLDSARSYGYVEVSTDDAATWKILPTALSDSANRYGLAYGPGFTGVSNLDKPRPYPLLGIVFNQDDMSIGELTENGPASHSDLQIGDRVIGYDGHTWPGPPDIFGLLNSYAPGDTLNLYVERGSEDMSVPVVLGAHPSRVITPEPIWVKQDVDLSAYAGKQIQVRFEYVSQPDAADAGIAIDNIAIPEISYQDDAESSSDWALQGWQQTANTVAQSFLLQYISTGTQSDAPRVRHLIGPQDTAVQGDWQFSIAPSEGIILAVSGLNDTTDQPAHFSLRLSQNQAPASG